MHPGHPAHPAHAHPARPAHAALPSVESLRCFCAAARLPSFRAAARAVALTPAAFGQRIRSLEDELGAVLFIRTTRSVRLSVAGLHLLPAAQRAIAAVEECARTVEGGAAMPAMSIVLGTRHELGISWVLPQIDALHAAHEFLELNLYFGSGGDLVNRVRNNEIDCAVTSTPIADPKLDALRLHREDYVFVAAPSLLRGAPFKLPRDAARHTLVDIDDGLPLFRYWREAPKGQPLEFARLARFGTIEAIRRRVLAGAGVAVLPRYLVLPDLTARRLAIVLPKVEPLHDWFRLVFRADDARRSAYALLAASMASVPLR
jgi:LysR family glycine cleavage system transcriptional activator